MAALVALVCAPQAAQAKTYPDVTSGSWYYDYVGYVSDNSLMTGYDSGIFAPEDSVTRAMVATVLYRYATGDKGSGGQVTHFNDVAKGQWYTKSVEWCYQEGIVTGYKNADGSSTGKFGPNDPVTREQLCTMLYRFADYYGRVSYQSIYELYLFPDGWDTSEYAWYGVCWCIYAGVISGDQAWNPAHINPQGYATRAQMAKMLTVLRRDVFGGADISDVYRYNYEFYVLGSADLPVYSGCNAIVYIKTDAPEGAFEYPSSTWSGDDYADLGLSSSSMTEGLYKVKGGYIAVLNYSTAGSYTIELTKYGKTLASYTIKVEDYTAARDAWIDSVLATLAAQPGWSSLDSFGKMSALCSYLLDNFTYRDTQNGSYLTLAKRSVPFFVSLRWDSYTSPAMLCLFAQKIGGFDDIHNCYGDYAYGSDKWYMYHFMCRVTIGDDVRYFMACPDYGTSEITSYSMVDYADTASFMHYDPSVLHSMGTPSALALSDAMVDGAADVTEPTDEVALEEPAGAEGEQAEAPDATDDEPVPDEGAEGATEGATDGEGTDGATEGATDGEGTDGKPAPDQSASDEGEQPADGEPADVAAEGVTEDIERPAESAPPADGEQDAAVAAVELAAA